VSELERPVDLAALRAEYRAFLRPGRVLLTGHSHQAWPDAAREALVRSFDDAAEHVDDKWERAVFPLVESVGRRVLGRLGFDEADPIAFGRSTHELVVRLLSSFPRRDASIQWWTHARSWRDFASGGPDGDLFRLPLDHLREMHESWMPNWIEGRA